MTAPPCPVTIRGVTYASAAEAARALDVHHSTIAIARKRGTLDAVGLRNSAGKPVKIRGVYYPSIREAARQIGVKHSSLLKAISLGTEQTCGLARETPVQVRGVTYTSTKACAKALGVTVPTIQKALRLGRADQLGLGTGHQEAMPVKVRGVTYPSAKACAKALGVTQQAVWSALSRGSIERLGLGVDYAKRNSPGGKPKPVVVAGQSFRSIADLARFIGRPPGTVRDSLKSGDDAKGRIVRAVLAKVAAQEAKVRKVREQWNVA